MKSRLVAAGNGMAGVRAVEEVLARGGAEQFEITIFGDEPYGNYTRILRSNVLSGSQDPDEIYLNPKSWYVENKIKLHAGARVTHIDRAARLVRSGGGITARYDKLLIATGSRAFIPPIEGVKGLNGAMKEGIFAFRTLDDRAGMIAQAKHSKRAVVMGGGLLGLEAARGLMNHGCEVHVIHLGSSLMEARLDVTGGQRIDLVGIAKEQPPDVWRDLDMPAGSAWAKSYRTCKSCIGTDFCRFGLGGSMGLAAKIETRFRGLDTPGKMKLVTAGCPRNGSEALIKDVGAVAIEDERWEIYVGGAGGSPVRKGDLLCTVASEDEVMTYTGRFTQWYRENAKYKERTYTFIERVGIERVRAVVVDDADGIASALDAEMERSVQAATDPWKEASKPKTENQFASLFPVDG